MTIRYKNAKTDLTTTNATDVFSVPNATTAVIKSILVSLLKKYTKKYVDVIEIKILIIYENMPIMMILIYNFHT